MSVIQERAVWLCTFALLSCSSGGEESPSTSSSGSTEPTITTPTEPTSPTTGTTGEPSPQYAIDITSGLPYHGVYPGGITGWEDDITDQDVQSYVDAVDHEVAWVYFSHNWFHGHEFPQATVQMIRDRGSIPWVRLMMRSELDEVTGADPTYPLTKILDGDFDEDLRAWGAAAAQVDGPLIVEWGTEMNGDWFSWNARHNGRVAGAPLFVSTYKHIVSTIEEGGAQNLTWVFHVNDESWPQASWNQMDLYDPGPEVCPWMAVSVYGVQVPNERGWWTFRDSMDAAYPQLVSVANGRPLIVAEFGVTDKAQGDATEWAHEALTDMLTGRWPEIRGLSWWNETWENDDVPAHDTEMRVQGITGMAEVFNQGLNLGVTERPVLKSSAAR